MYVRSPSRFFNWYLFGSLFTELILLITSGLDIVNWRVIYFFLLFELLFLGLTYSDFSKPGKPSGWVKVVTLIGLLICFAFHWLSYPLLVYGFRNLFLVLLACWFLAYFIKQDKSSSLWLSARMWIATGIFINFFAVSVVSMLLKPEQSWGDLNLSSANVIILLAVKVLSNSMYAIGLYRSGNENGNYR